MQLRHVQERTMHHLPLSPLSVLCIICALFCTATTRVVPIPKLCYSVPTNALPLVRPSLCDAVSSFNTELNRVENGTGSINEGVVKRKALMSRQ